MSLFARSYPQLALKWINLLFLVTNSGRPAAVVELCGRIDGVKVIIRLWVLDRLWAEESRCHRLRPRVPIPTDPSIHRRSRDNPEFWVTFALTPVGRRVFYDHIREKLEERSYWTGPHKRLQHLRCAQELCRFLRLSVLQLIEKLKATLY